ncbi:T9SS type A sorting domain-containing protein [candidate division TA06 bacterium]|uniref:T9SS type A sorting domain-containing protein n=1 Tax=candidate division TA06 bacterium TaxID=2250710 RepID=A0A933MKX0_UNCT6|nr:T9SS type A sorting domain-containing protein [candidate division TA06 bacterium]
MALKNIPPRRLSLKLIFSLLLFLLFENICLGGQWTMMFYMAADNDLYSQALTDIEELRKIAGKAGIEILIQFDSPSGAFRYRVLPQGISTLASLGQSNSGSPEALADFGLWAVKTYPARKYLLVLWDHGDGWSKRAKGIGIDGLDYLSVAGGELREALADISSVAGQPLDIVVFDACFMQMAEVLMELDGICRYAVGSEAGFPAESMPYDMAWKDIDGNTPAESLAVRLVNSCSTFDDLGYQATCSAVDINSLSAAAQNLKPITGHLRQLPVSACVCSSAVTDSVLSFLPWYSYDLPLALDFIGNRIPDPEKTLVLDISRQFKNSVLAQFIAGDDYQKANGLAAWYPNGKYNFESGIEAYRNLKWSGLSGWDKILYQLIFQQDSTAPVPQQISLDKESEGVWKLSWDPGYEPSGIETYQIRHSQGLVTDFLDQSGSADSANWIKTGFAIVSRGAGDTAYYSIGGQMTIRDAFQCDSTGNIGLTAEGLWGSLVLESSPDTLLGWDTLGVWNFYGPGELKYCSAKVKTSLSRIRLNWKPFSSGWVYIDDIKVCHPDPAKSTQIISSPSPVHKLLRQPDGAGYYQVRAIDSLNNISSWSEAVFYRLESGFATAWPNPFKSEIMLAFSTGVGQSGEVKIYNVLGQYIDKMSLRQKKTNGDTAEYLYHWAPKTSLSNGIYLARISSGLDARTVKMILIR